MSNYTHMEEQMIWVSVLILALSSPTNKCEKIIKAFVAFSLTSLFCRSAYLWYKNHIKQLVLKLVTKLDLEKVRIYPTSSQCAKHNWNSMSFNNSNYSSHLHGLTMCQGSF